jgi:2-keto-3-deoxy-6-phosphogluconate aldolase
MGSLAQDEFESTLLQLSAEFLNNGNVTQVFECGGVGRDNFAEWRECGANGFGIRSHNYKRGDAATEVSEKSNLIVATYDEVYGK